MNVVDLSQDVAGRFAAKLMAMAGLSVCRPILQEKEQLSPSPLDTYLDAAKKHVAHSDREFRELLRDADILFTSFECGAHSGIEQWRDLVAPGAIHIVTSPFGTSGPYSQYRGGNLADWAAGGYLAITGDPDREPLKGPDTLCSYVGGYTAALAAEAALVERMTTGIGRSLDISTMESMLCVHQSTFSRMAVGSIRQRTGRYAEVYPLTVLPCKDGYVSLGVVTDEEFDRLAIAIDKPQLLSDDRFATREARMSHCDALDAELQDFLSERAALDVVGALQAGGVPASVVAEPEAVLTNPQLAHRGFWVKPERGGVMPGNPVPAARCWTANALANSVPDVGKGGVQSLPLSGVVVLDFTAFWAGPAATRTLADLGATVIWVERPGSRIDPNPEGESPLERMQYVFQQKMHRGKYSIAVDLTSSEGRKKVQQLLPRADVIVENFRPGVAAKLGIDPQTICADYPRLVYVSLSGYGADGPLSAWGSYGPNLEAASSVMARTGYIDGAPLRLGHTLPDGVGGLQGALAALRGLRERSQTGVGGWFDLSQLEAYTAMSGEGILSAALGEKYPRMGNASPESFLQGVFPCSGNDQWIALSFADEEELGHFARVTGSNKLGDLMSAGVTSAILEAALAEYTVSQEKHALARFLQQQGLEAMPVMTADDLVKDPHLRERGFLMGVKVGGKTQVVPGTPLHTSGGFTDTRRRAPRFGEHTDDALSLVDTEQA